jgi:branched-chain amino acid transport system permease protein
VMAVVLALRPQGLLGRPGAAAREPAAPPLVLPAPRALRLLALLAFLALAAAPLLVGPFAISVLTEAMIAVLFAASLHFMMGPGGMPSFGHAAWFGIGAYAAALTASALTWPLPAALLAAVVAAGIVAAAFAWFVVRLAGVYLAMLTLAFAQIVWAIALQWSSFTGGDNGILGLWPRGALADPRAFYWFALVLCGAGALLLRRILYAPFGYALRAARDSAVRAEAIGLPTTRLRLAAFVIAGAAAGLSGALSTFSKGSVFPATISIGRSVDALLMVLLGGVQTIAGPIVGALVYTGLYDALLLATSAWRLALGAAIVALVLAFPQGIAGAVQQAWRGAA